MAYERIEMHTFMTHTLWIEGENQHEVWGSKVSRDGAVQHDDPVCLEKTFIVKRTPMKLVPVQSYELVEDHGSTL